ncbi:MaoC family dehydratase [Aestuariirhabdus litorea]|uniref:MaoC family dehydratase n=1 Tax=Aestuariirhabdus litorea TaxID=2528527 RepID=A0A3P3VJ40_9GAMM|nr:MaoC family dehydratase [Aestuariirhabdus litorea]RRJ82735.1 MaoC family dehydratase [Aestuariirhabdus litorea]RWW92895.1 MaoC family dehydratase [Endozoicomonadaceae bacterium GTF-13]
MLQQVSAAQLPEYIGKALGSSDWFCIDQARINAFAEATLDHQFIHVDEARAATTPFGSTIAHGFLTLSLIPHLSESVGIVPENLVMGINYGCDKLRFLQPVTVGSEVRLHSRLLEVTEKNPGQFLFKNEITIEIKGQSKPALIAEWLTMMITSNDN